MDLRWTPEPSPDEREALERALRRLLTERKGSRSGWWREGVEEAVSLDEES